MELDSSERKPSLAEVLARWVDGSMEGLPKAIPAMVTAYDAAAQKVSCKPLIMRPFLDESDARQVDSVPIITGCPVVFPGAAGFRATFPISDGNLVIGGQTIKATTGLLLFCDRSIDKWLSGSGDEVDPEIDHFHSLSDGVFLPGLNPFGAPLGSCPADMTSIGSDTDGNGRIDFQKDKVQLGSGATKEVARKGDSTRSGTLAVVMGVGPLAASVASVVWVSPSGAINTLTTGNLGPVNLDGEITSGSGHIAAVD